MENWRDYLEEEADEAAFDNFVENLFTKISKLLGTET